MQGAQCDFCLKFAHGFEVDHWWQFHMNRGDQGAAPRRYDFCSEMCAYLWLHKGITKASGA